MSTADKPKKFFSDQPLVFLTKYTSLGASSRYRTLQYLPSLPQGLNYEVQPLFDDDYLRQLYNHLGKKPLWLAFKGYLKRLWVLLILQPGATVVLENELWPYLPFWLEKLFLKKCGRLVLIYDDAIFHHYDRSANPWLKLNRSKIGQLMRSANLSIVGNHYLADYAAQWTKSCRIIPTVIDSNHYKSLKDYSRKSEKLQLIWVGSPATAEYLQTLNRVWNDPWVIANCELTLLGAGKDVRISGITVKNLAWQSEREVLEMQNCDVGIMPLPDSPWTRGKCGFKLIQYMAAGLPCLASPVGANAEIVLDGETGFLTSEPTAWIEKLRILQENPALIEQMGKQAKHRAFENYSLQATEELWKACILNDLPEPV